MDANPARRSRKSVNYAEFGSGGGLVYESENCARARAN
jgi:hypothetical protein